MKKSPEGQLTEDAPEKKREWKKKGYLWNSWNRVLGSQNVRSRSRSLSVVVSSISTSGFSVTRPWEDPFKSKRLWTPYSDQNTFPITTKRTCLYWMAESNSLTIFEMKLDAWSRNYGADAQYHLSLHLSCKLDAVQAKEPGDKGTFTCPDVVVVGWKHPQKHLCHAFKWKDWRTRWRPNDCVLWLGGMQRHKNG